MVNNTNYLIRYMNSTVINYTYMVIFKPEKNIDIKAIKCCQKWWKKINRRKIWGFFILFFGGEMAPRIQTYFIKIIKYNNIQNYALFNFLLF